MPIPRFGVPGDRKRYPFDRLSVGDSFVVPFERSGPATLKDVVRTRQAKHPGEAYRVIEHAEQRETEIVRIE